MNTLTQKRKVIKQRTTRIQTYVDNVVITSVTTTDIQLRLDKLDEGWNEFNEVQNEIEALCTEEQLEAQNMERDAFETKYFATKSALISLRKQLEPTGTTTSSIPAGTASNTTKADVKLPRLDLPIFSGSYQEWSSFYDLFTAVVHNNASISPVQKLHYLKTSLRGEAARLIHSVQITDANYTEAWKILTERYENKRQIVCSHLKSLFGQASLHNESAVGLRKLIECTVEHVRSLHVLGQPTDHWDSILIHLVSERLDPDTRRQWELSIAKSDLPTFEQLKAFLEQRCRALEAAGPTRSKMVPPPPPTPQRQKQATYYANTKPSCAYCKLEHAIYQCPKFIHISVPERTSFVRQHSLCFNCLRVGHAAQYCKSSLCRNCNGRHHTLLHHHESPVETKGQGNTLTSIVTHPITAVANNRTDVKIPIVPTTVLLSTAIVKVTDAYGRQQFCRALLDSGSQSSFITEACIQRLGLRRTRVSVPVHGIGNTGSSLCRGMIHLKIGSRISSFNMSVDALILQTITSLLPDMFLDHTNWPHLQTLALADPTFHQRGPVDILLGADVFNTLLLDGRLVGPAGTPSAQNTQLGWILAGKLSMQAIQGGEMQGVRSNHVQLTLNDQLKQFWELEEVSQPSLLTKEQESCEKHFHETHTRDATGRFIVKLPFHENDTCLGDSREMAIKRFLQTERRLERCPSLKRDYVHFMEEYLELGHMEPVPVEEINKPVGTTYYLPHHAVLKDSSTTTRLRVVFDGSAKTSTGSSLNDWPKITARVDNHTA